MNRYKQRALEGASGVELTIALYDGIVRFVREAAAAVDRGDEAGRRRSIKRAMDIVIHLQGTLRMDVGGKPAEALSEFYTSIFALMLQGSMEASRERFEKAIAYVLNVRDAWRQVANENPPMPAESSVRAVKVLRPEFAHSSPVRSESHEIASRWTA